tara:strand:+ start:2016 stop:2351 length:336 start_codon:yes stop_codon:yes gene_type:complete
MASSITNLNLYGLGDTAGNGTYNSGTATKINPSKGGDYCFISSGTFSNGTTLTLQHKVGEAYVDIGSDAVLTAPGGCVFTSTQSDLQLVVSNRTGTSAKNESLYVAIAPVS